MAFCRSCSHEVSDTASFCPSCGEPMAVADAPTFDRSAEADDATLHKPTSSSSSRPISHSSDSFPHGRFLPGMMIGGRFRIVSMLGRGGMGEVYRADDLSLGQQVALKFLPSELADDPERLERFRQEVRLARQVSHPNVCRVYDIGEIDGEHFISMEYIEGEDLGHLLRRIGQLPEAKAIQIARQIAAGLAAAHDRNLVHRDLKPANIMLDERGMVRITDFGLAATTEELEQGGTREGTPQYMAPEQLEGGAVTSRSDVYSLGLVLFELFTGRRAFDARTLSELMQIREESDVSSLSNALSGIDPVVERVILRCLERDPGQRPQSALAVSAALPGGDPLAAALAAGETPSPDMVAAAGDDGALSIRAAVALLVLSLVFLAVLPFLSRWSRVAPPLTIEHGPEVMRTKAREMLERLGFESEPAGVAYAYFPMNAWFNHLEESSDDIWASINESPHPLFGFWYRESPVPLVNHDFFSPGIAGGVVSFGSPYPETTGEARVIIDDRGRLWGLSAPPPQVPDREVVDRDPFQLMLAEAGLDVQSMTPAVPEWSPPFFATERRAWTTTLDGEIDMRIEAAAYDDQPVYFTRIFEWSEPQRSTPVPPPTSQVVMNALQIFLFFLVIGGAVFMANRNIRMGRGDRRGAFRLAVFVLLSILVLWIFDADHVASLSEFGLLVIALCWALFFGLLFWVIYVALEPYIRRRWPGMLISWSRLLSGRVRDSLVGRDLLVGASAGIAINILVPHLLYLLHGWIEGAVPRPRVYNAAVIEGFATTIATIFSQLTGAMAAAFFAAFLLFLLLVLLRREWLAAAAVVAVGGAISTLGSEGGWIAAVVFFLIWALIVATLVRFGMLAAIVAIFSANTLSIAGSIPGGFGELTTGPILISMAVGATLLTGGFILSLGNRSLFSSADPLRL